MLDDLKRLKGQAEKKGKIPKEKMLPFLNLAEKMPGGGVKSLGVKRVVVTGSKIVTGRDYYTKKSRQELVLFVDHNGTEKQYRKPILEQTKDDGGHLLPEEERDVHYFIIGLIRRNVDVGDELVLEYQRSGKTGFINVEKVGKDGVDDPVEEDIPVIEEGEYDSNSQVIDQGGTSDSE